MGAGFAGSTANKVNVNVNTAGGSKKQGGPALVGLGNWSNRNVSINANGQNKSRYFIFNMNQLGGVGAGKSQFNTGNSYARPDGVKGPYQITFN